MWFLSYSRRSLLYLQYGLMKKLFMMFFFLISFEVKSQTEEWVLTNIGQIDGKTIKFYLDINNIKKNGNFVSITRLDDKFIGNIEIGSTKHFLKLDCINSEFETIKILEFTNNMGKGSYENIPIIQRLIPFNKNISPFKELCNI